MNVRFPLLLLVMTVTASFAQTGMYGPVTNHPKAGDIAPDLSFTKVLNAPDAAAWNSSYLFGRLTVVAFFPDTSHNLQAATQWNALIDEYAGKPVQFVWVTGEESSTLVSWLKQHPLQGWVLHDPADQTAKAYGLTDPLSVYIGADGRIAGFASWMLPDANTVDAALEGRITHTPPTQANLKEKVALLDAEPRKLFAFVEHKPAFPPSYTLHVSPSQSEGTDSSFGMDYWSLKGYGLKEVLFELYKFNPVRIELPASLNSDQRYDFALRLPEQESEEKMRDRFRQGIEDYFHVSVARENRLVDVYVVTATGRKPRAAKLQEGFAVSSGSSVQFETVGGTQENLVELKAVSLAGVRGVRTDGTVDDFCHLLESQLDRPVVNETHLKGNFEFDVESSKDSQNDFLDRLRDQSGLVITPARRTVEVLVLRPH